MNHLAETLPQDHPWPATLFSAATVVHAMLPLAVDPELPAALEVSSLEEEEPQVRLEASHPRTFPHQSQYLSL